MCKANVSGIVTLLGWWIVANAAMADSSLLFQDRFVNPGDQWQAHHRAWVDPLTRRPGGRSIAIEQADDQQADSHWLSPAIPLPEGPNRSAVRISFWAADNYTVCPDVTYAAAVDVIRYDAHGQLIGQTMNLIPMHWDESRQGPMSGPLLEEGLLWRYYELDYQLTGDHFRLKLHWPKTLARGKAYLTDLRVTTIDVDQMTAAPSDADAAAGSTLTLELSTPVQGNLFYADDRLQFEVLVHNHGQPLDLPSGARLVYDVTDYQHFHVAAGQADFSGASPLADPAFASSEAGHGRTPNLHQSLVVRDESARQVGRLMFMRVKLVDDAGNVLAGDTVTYGVVDPRPLDAKAMSSRRFGLRHFQRGFTPTWADADRPESVAEKMGIGWYYVLDYGWQQRQPVHPGSITFGDPLPDFPKQIFLPNIEQLRGRPDDHPHGSVLTRVPQGAAKPDPLRPGRHTFDIDAYVDYMVAYIRHHRQHVGMVVPAGLERPIDDLTIELHKKAYTAIKAAFPDLPVGLMLYGTYHNPSRQVDQFLEHELYDYCDFIDDHFYVSNVDWTQWKRIQQAYRDMGRQPVPMVSTEFSRVGGMDQVQRSRDMLRSHLDAFAHGVQLIAYYNTLNHQRIDHPFLREPTDLGGDMNSGFLFMQRVDRPRVSPDLVVAEGQSRWARGGHAPRGESLMPILQTMTYYNMVQHFEAADYRTTLQPDAHSVAYLFDRPDVTVLAIWLNAPLGERTYVIRTDEPFTMQDLFGRTERITPHHGQALISVSDNPVVLAFDKPVQDIDVEPTTGGLRAGPMVRGSGGQVVVSLPAGLWQDAGALDIDCTVDGTWPEVAGRSLDLSARGDRQVTFDIALDPARLPGRYPLTARLRIGQAVVGVLKADLTTTDALVASVTGLPLLQGRDPGIEVTLSNHHDQPRQGVVRFVDRWFSLNDRPQVREAPFHIPAGQQGRVVLPLPAELINLTAAYDIEVQIQTDQGIQVQPAEVAFRGVQRAPGPITIDGDLSDWQLDQRTAIPFAHEYTQQGKQRTDPDDLDARLYTLWDDQYLYFAAVVRDDSAVVRADTLSIWKDDNIMLGLHPWGWQKDQPLHSGYYREHLGLCLDGESRIFRVGRPAEGPAQAVGARIAVTRTTDGYIYEWAYPREAIVPLNLQAGSRFRLSLYVLDRDVVDPQQETFTPLGGLMLGGFNTNVDARPEKWREFVLVD